MALISLLAVGLMVLRFAVRYWGPGEAMAIAPIVLVATNVLAWFQKARWQLFWIGFGLCGWAYLTFILSSGLAEYLPTAWLLDGLHDRLYPNGPPTGYDIGFDDEVGTAQAHSEAFKRAGQSLVSLLFALLGGGAAVALFPARSENEAPRPPNGSLLKPGFRDMTSGDPSSAPRVANRRSWPRPRQ
jgi:hypothetical protein